MANNKLVRTHSALTKRRAVKLAFHGADIDTDTDFLARILADTSDTRD